MQDGWNTILKQLVDLPKKCGETGQKAAKDMRQLHKDYWHLLLETSNRVGKLLTQC